MVPALLEIALAEKKPDEIIKWYDHPALRHCRSLLSNRLDHQVAQAVSRTYPDRAVKIWRWLAEREISTTKVSAYPLAARYLRGVKDTLVRAGRTNEWNSYLAQLLEKNRRKTKCVETLKRIVSPK